MTPDNHLSGYDADVLQMFRHPIAFWRGWWKLIRLARSRALEPSVKALSDDGLRAMVDGTIGKLKDFYVFRSQFVNKTGTAPITTARTGLPPVAAATTTSRTAITP